MDLLGLLIVLKAALDSHSMDPLWGLLNVLKAILDSHSMDLLGLLTVLKAVLDGMVRLWGGERDHFGGRVPHTMLCRWSWMSPYSSPVPLTLAVKLFPNSET